MCEVVSQISEIACSEIASAAIEDISKKNKISPFHLAVNVEGLVHDHPPCEYNVETCTYCKRNGNIFAKDGSRHTMPDDDVISKYKKKVTVILEEMFREITNVVYDKAFNNDESEIESDDETSEDEDEQDEELMLERMLSQAFGKPKP
jgi:hypothetical protein